MDKRRKFSFIYNFMACPFGRELPLHLNRSSSRSPCMPRCYISLLSTLPFASIPMLWENAKIYISTVCLKYLVICIANALLTTGWLVLSVLSLCGELLPAILEAPPTLPRLPSRHGSTAETNAARFVSDESQRRMVSRGKPTLVKSDIVGTAPPRSSSLEPDTLGQHVKIMSGYAAHVVRTPPRIPTPPTMSRPLPTLESAQVIPTTASPDALPSAQSFLGNTPASLETPGRKGSARGRRLNFLRKRSSEQSSSSLTCGTRSQATSPERSDQPGGKPCLKKMASTCGSIQTAKVQSAPVPRTNPYEAPYFFPTPLSPEAHGYIHRVRMERSPSNSPEYRVIALPGNKTIASPPISPPIHNEIASEAHTVSDGHMSSGEGSADEEGRLNQKPVRRILSFSSHNYIRPRKSRPTSWGSEAPTLDISRSMTSFDSSNRTTSSLPRQRLGRLWSRRGGQPLSILPPLESVSVVGFNDLPSVAPSPEAEVKPKRFWYPRFRQHHRSVSDSIHNVAVAPVTPTSQRSPLKSATD